MNLLTEPLITKRVVHSVAIPNLRELRKAAGFTLDALAHRAAVSVGTVLNAQKGKPVLKRVADAILGAMPANGNGNGTVVAAEPVPIIAEPEDPIVTAFKLFLEQIDERIDKRIARALATKVAPPSPPTVTPAAQYTPVVKEPEVLVSQQGAISHGFPVVAALNNWAIRYERKFVKEVEVSGLDGQVRATLQKFAQLGETYSGLGFKKLEKAMAANRRSRWGGAQYAFRINQRWRILARKDVGDKAYTITRLIHHDEIE